MENQVLQLTSFALEMWLKRFGENFRIYPLFNDKGYNDNSMTLIEFCDFWFIP